MKRSGLYTLVLITCAAGFIWLGYLVCNPQVVNDQSVSICPIKSVTHLPCPSCGSSRAILSLFQGDLSSSLYRNPLGILIACIMIISPLWIMSDLFRQRDSFLQFYRHTEKTFRLKWVAIPAILLMMANWIWNIMKEI